MTISKQKIIDAIQDLPQSEFEEIDTVIEQIILLEKIERGLDAIRNGNVLTEEQLYSQLASW